MLWPYFLSLDSSQILVFVGLVPGRLPKTETGLSSERGGTNEREMGISENEAVTVMLYVSARLEVAANSSTGLCLHTRCLLHVVSICWNQELYFALKRRQLYTRMYQSMLAFLCASSELS